MKKTLTRTPQADEDAIEMFQYIGRDNPAAGEEYFDALYRAFDTILAHPDIGTLFTRAQGELTGLRFLPLSAKFRNHLLFYIPVDQQVRVIRILRKSRDIEPLFLDE